MPDLADAAARFGAELRVAGMPVGPDRCARFAQAITVVDADSVRELYWCAMATLVSDPAQLPVFESVFSRVFEGFVDPAEQRGQGASAVTSSSGGVPSVDGRPGGSGRPTDVDVPLLASAGERLATRDFAELTAEELALLVDVMRQLVLRTPVRRSRRQRRAAGGSRVDLRSSLRTARRTGGYPVRLERTTARLRPRRLVVLCDISGSMQPYARAMTQLLYCAAKGRGAEVFAFATRLTRLTAVLGGRPTEALERAGKEAPDWSGGTRIGSALQDFLRDFGRRGVARGAVVLIISDGWESGDPGELGAAMAALSRLAFRVVWANPRVARAGYRPLVGGMAVAWPYCDAVVSAHRLDALPELLDALADPTRKRRPG
jgi:uncharacterized protein with von Willebrand factor type A (vWA) domain